MKRFVVIIGITLCASLAGWGQEAERPWETWEAPVVAMPDPNASDLYQQAFALMDRLNPPDEQPMPATQEFLDRNRFFFRLLQEAMMGECRLAPILYPAQALPYMSKFRMAARMFTARAMVYREDQRFAEAALDCVACVRLGADVSTQHSVIAGLVDIACGAIGLAALEEIIPEMQPDDCRIAIEALRAANAERGSLTDALESERTRHKLMMKEEFSQMGSDMPLSLVQDLGLTDEEIKEALTGWQPADSWSAYDEFFEAVFERARKPYWERAEVPTPGDPLLDLVVPVYKVSAVMEVKFAMRDALLRLAIVHLAAQAYRLDKGVVPAHLDALVPEYLDEIPADPFADAPLRSTILLLPARAHPAMRRAEGLIIYSVGPDGVDDGGEDAGERLNADVTGDIVVTLSAVADLG